MQTYTSFTSHETSSHQLAKPLAKVPYETTSSVVTDDDEDQAPVMRKKVVVKASKQKETQSLGKSASLFHETLSTDVSYFLTPMKPGDIRPVQKCNSAATTVKKPSEFLEDVSLATTVNKNKMNKEESQSEKTCHMTVIGKRLYEQVYVEEDEREFCGTQESVRELFEREEKMEMSTVKKLKLESQTVAQEKVYYYNQTKNEMSCFPVFLDKDLGYGEFIQETLKETDIDNDCNTDTEVMEQVKDWTMKDLAEGIQKHFEEKAKEEAAEKEKVLKEVMEEVDEAEEKFKKIIESFAGLASDSEDDESEDGSSGSYVEIKFLAKESKEKTEQQQPVKRKLLSDILLDL